MPFPANGLAMKLCSLRSIEKFIQGKYKMQTTGKWKGYDVYGGSNVVIARKGTLPYLPVTRKQYLDRAIPYVTKFYDQMIKDGEAVPVRTFAEQEAEKNKVLDNYKKN